MARRRTAGGLGKTWTTSVGPQFRDGEFQVAGLRGHRLLAVPIAPGGAGVGVLAPLGADLRGGLGLDQFLQQPLGDLTNEFKPIGRT